MDLNNKKCKSVREFFDYLIASGQLLESQKSYDEKSRTKLINGRVTADGRNVVAGLDWSHVRARQFRFNNDTAAEPLISSYDKLPVTTHGISGDLPMPQSVVDVGLRMEPNLELIRALRPDLILLSPMQQASVPLLERIAPVQLVAFNAPEQPDSYQQARVATALACYVADGFRQLSAGARGDPPARPLAGPAGPGGGVAARNRTGPDAAR